MCNWKIDLSTNYQFSPMSPFPCVIKLPMAFEQRGLCVELQVFVLTQLLEEKRFMTVLLWRARETEVTLALKNKFKPGTESPFRT